MAFAVTITVTGRVVGEIPLTCTSETAQQAATGCLFHPDCGGKGIATEAAQAVLDTGFISLDDHRVFARLDEDNRASARLYERLGIRQEATLVESDLRVSSYEPEGARGTELVFALLRKQWAGSIGEDNERPRS